jgi:hypothetical protein
MDRFCLRSAKTPKCSKFSDSYLLCGVRFANTNLLRERARENGCLHTCRAAKPFSEEGKSTRWIVIQDSAAENARLLDSAKSTTVFDPKFRLADSYLQLSTMSNLPLDRLTRYESTLWRQARQIIFTLESLRWRKREPKRISFPYPFRRKGESSVPNGNR